MLQLVLCELQKLKKCNILWVIATGALFSAFMTFIQFVMAQNIDHQAADFEQFYMAAIWNNFFVAFPLIITLMGGMIFNQEYSNGTLKAILTIPISIKKLYAAKIIVIGFLVLALSIVNDIFVFIGANLLHLQGINGLPVMKSLLQICGIAIFIYIAVLPLIIWGFRKVNGYYPMLCIAFIYGFFGNFLIPRGLGDFYPITAGLRIIQYAVLPEGNIFVALLAVAIMILISVGMICLAPYSYERAIQNNKKPDIKNDMDAGVDTGTAEVGGR